MSNLPMLGWAALFAAPFMLSCNDKESANKDEPYVDVEVNKDKIAKDFRKARDAFVAKSEKSLETLGKEISELDGKIESAAGEAKEDLQERVDKLETRRKELSKELEKAREVSADRWSQFEKSVSGSFGELEDDYNQVLERLKTE